MISLSVAKLLGRIGGATRLRRLLAQYHQPVPAAAAVAQWKVRNVLPRKWVAPVLLVLTREGVDPVSVMDGVHAQADANGHADDDDPFAEAEITA